jgi:hypothetical protein
VLFIAYIVMWGITPSRRVSLLPTALVEQFGIQNSASINELLYMIRGFATLGCTPVGGALIHTHVTVVGTVMGYEGIVLLVGTLVMGATIFVSWARLQSATQSGCKRCA